MNPGGGLIEMINMRLSDTTDTAFRDKIRTLHANQTPLVDMVVELGLAELMSPAVRTVVESLEPQEVAAIRQATIDMLDRSGDELPVDCKLTQAAIDAGAPVDVSVVSKDRISTITVRAT